VPYVAPTFTDGLPVAAATLQALANEVQRLSPLPRGEIARGFRTSVSSNSTGAVVPVLRVDAVPIELGRAYEILTSGLNLNTSVNLDTVDAHVRYVTGGGAAIIGSGVLPGARIRDRIGIGAESGIFSLVARHTAAATTTASFLLCVQRSNGTGNAQIYGDAGGQPIELIIRDVGVAAADTGVDL
jgi:hypothetical protein